MEFKISAIAVMLIGSISDLVNKFTPDEITEEEKEKVQKLAVPVYAVAKTYGADLVESTETDIDDQLLEEAIQICEEAADKYGFTLNAEEL